MKNSLVLVLILISRIGLGQSNKDRTYLKVGEQFPFAKVFSNYPDAVGAMKGYKGKLLILDIWGVYCSSCIEAFPEMEKLQNDFKNKIKIVLVSNNNKLKVNKLANYSTIFKNIKLPVLTGESGIAKMFEYPYVPTHVWVNQRGVIEYIFDGRNTTSINIKKFLAGESIKDSFPFRERIKLNFSDPLNIQFYPYFKNNYLFNSYLALADRSNYGYLTFVSGGEDKNGLSNGFRGTIYGFHELYKIAYFGFEIGEKLSDSRLLLSAKDSIRFAEDFYNSKNIYIYELGFPKGLPAKKVYKFMQIQLDLAFNVESGLVKKKIPCLVLKTSGFNNNLWKGQENRTSSTEIINNLLIFRNSKWKNIISNIRQYSKKSKFELCDETGFADTLRASMTISKDFDDVPNLRKSIEPYGLIMDVEYRELDCISIRTE